MLRIRWSLLPPSAQALHWACGPAFASREQRPLSKLLHNIPKLSLTGELVIPSVGVNHHTYVEDHPTVINLGTHLLEPSKSKFESHNQG